MRCFLESTTGALAPLIVLLAMLWASACDCRGLGSTGSVACAVLGWGLGRHQLRSMSGGCSVARQTSQAP